MDLIACVKDDTLHSCLHMCLVVFVCRTNHPLICSSGCCFMCSSVHRWYFPFRLQALQFRLQAVVRLVLFFPLTTAALAICPCGQKIKNKKNKKREPDKISLSRLSVPKTLKRGFGQTQSRQTELAQRLFEKLQHRKLSNRRHIQNKKTKEKETSPERESVVKQQNANNAAKSYICHDWKLQQVFSCS